MVQLHEPKSLYILRMYLGSVTAFVFRMAMYDFTQYSPKFNWRLRKVIYKSLALWWRQSRRTVCGRISLLSTCTSSTAPDIDETCVTAARSTWAASRDKLHFLSMTASFVVSFEKEQLKLIWFFYKVFESVPEWKVIGNWISIRWRLSYTPVRLLELFGYFTSKAMLKSDFEMYGQLLKFSSISQILPKHHE